MTMVLSVSSAQCCPREALLETLCFHGVVAQVVETVSTVSSAGRVVVESGFQLTVTNLAPTDFEARLWRPLGRLMPIECAHVRHGDQYTGCVQNWPGVLVATRCAGVSGTGGRPVPRARSAGPRVRFEKKLTDPTSLK